MGVRGYRFFLKHFWFKDIIEGSLFPYGSHFFKKKEGGTFSIKCNDRGSLFLGVTLFSYI